MDLKDIADEKCPKCDMIGKSHLVTKINDSQFMLTCVDCDTSWKFDNTAKIC